MQKELMFTMKLEIEYYTHIIYDSKKCIKKNKSECHVSGHGACIKPSYILLTFRLPMTVYMRFSIKVLYIDHFIQNSFEFYRIFYSRSL